jgi:hypothetical protein
MSRKLRGVAQLVARVLWEHEVAGSNPVTPTISGKRAFPWATVFFSHVPLDEKKTERELPGELPLPRTKEAVTQTLPISLFEREFERTGPDGFTIASFDNKRNCREWFECRDWIFCHKDCFFIQAPLSNHVDL